MPIVVDFDGDGKDNYGCHYPSGGDLCILKITGGFMNTRFDYEGTIPLGGTLR